MTDPYGAFSFTWPAAIPEKTADIPWYQHCFQREMTSEEQAQKFHTIYPDLDSASDWWKQVSHVAQPIRSTNQIWEATRHQYGIFALVSQTPASFRRETKFQIYWNKRKSGSNPEGSVWDTKIAVLRLFWDSKRRTRRHVKTLYKRLGHCFPAPPLQTQR